MAVFYPLYLFCGVLVATTTILSIVTASKVIAKKKASSYRRISCKCKACTEKTKYFTTFRSLHILEPLTLCLIIFTTIIALSTFVGQTTITDAYNPYKVLKVPDRSQASVVNSAHTRLLRSFKNDKASSKDLDDAHAYLSNSTIRKNYERYGNHAGLKLVGFGNTFIPPKFFDFIESKFNLILFFIILFILFFAAMHLIVKRLKKTLNRDDMNITIKVYKKLLKESPTTEDVIESLSASSK